MSDVVRCVEWLTWFGHIASYNRQRVDQEIHITFILVLGWVGCEILIRTSLVALLVVIKLVMT